jgi:hypothetical protein
MSVQVKLTSVKQLSNSSTASVVELSNFNFSTITSAIKEFLASINYGEGTSSVSVDIGTIASDLVTIRQGLSVYGTQLQENAYPTVINLSPTGAVTAKNFTAEDVAEVRRLRIRVFGAIPTVGIPGEIIYVEGQGSYQEGIYVWLASSGWTLLSGGGGGNAACMQEVIMSMAANAVSTNYTLASDSLYLVPAPMPSSGFMFFVNGQLLPVGDGTRNAPAYLSNDNGVTAVLFNEADSNSRLYWNTGIAGFELETSDNLTLHYFTIDPFCNQAGYSCNTQVANLESSTTFQFGVEIISNGASSTPVTICRTPNPTTNTGGETLTTGYYLQNSVLSFSITDWDGAYSSGAIVKFTAPSSISETDFNNLRVFRQDELGNLTDVTILAGDDYLPDYENRWIYADVPGFSPFYLIVGIGEATTTSTSTTTTTTSGPTTTTTTTCAPNGISFVTSYGTHPTQATFYGTPTGPFYVTFVDQYSTEHDLTGLLGNQISMSWTFNVENPVFAAIPSVVGVYTFSTAGGCSYEVTVPIGSTTTTTTFGTTTTTSTTTTSSTTTTTTAGPTTTTTTSTTTTTTLPPRVPRTTTTTSTSTTTTTTTP